MPIFKSLTAMWGFFFVPKIWTGNVYNVIYLLIGVGVGPCLSMNILLGLNSEKKYPSHDVKGNTISSW